MLQTKIIDHTLQITLNNPSHLNALNQQLLSELQQALTQAKEDPIVRSILIHGQGKAFCAGADIKQLQHLDHKTGTSFAKHGQHVFNLLSKNKPSIAAIHGLAMGGGLELAMSATLRIAAHDTKFSQPEINLGIIPGFGGTQRLPRLIGTSRTLHMCLTGETIDTTKALAWGLITDAVPAEKLLEQSLAICNTINNLPQQAINGIITSIMTGTDLSLPAGLDLEAAQFGLCCQTDNHKEGVAAFLAKRKPSFTHE